LDLPPLRYAASTKPASGLFPAESKMPPGGAQGGAFLPKTESFQRDVPVAGLSYPREDEAFAQGSERFDRNRI
jgi:hypothetical protein